MSNTLVSPVARTVRHRYRYRFCLAMTIYALAVATISGWLGWKLPKQGWGLYLAAVFPAFPVGAAIYAMGRYLIEEPDEFVRTVQVKATLFALGLTMFTCTAWGFLAQYAHVWGLPLYLVFPMWAGWLGLTTPIVNRSYR